MSEASGVSNRPGPASSAEPSMEEILASIRRILAEEQNMPEFLAEEEGELLLDSSMRVIPLDELSTSATGLPQSADPLEAASSIFSQPSLGSDKEVKMEDHVHSPEGIVSEQVIREMASSVGSLLRSVSADRAVGVGRGSLTLEDMVREELKPMLKAWMDTHLPGMVERVVRIEINRVLDAVKE